MAGGKRGKDEVTPIDEDVGAQAPATADSELALDDDERLPWLESADYEDDEGGVDAGRIVGFAILGLLALAIIIGGIWYFGNRPGDGEPAPDGSTIAAPEGPYKVKPENPGGRIAEGTGDVAPAVGEGKTREGRIAESPAPKPSIDAAGSKAEAVQSGVGVQVGAFSTRETAERGWATLMRQTEALNGVSHRIVEGQADIGKVFRLQAVAGDRAAADRLCEALQSDGVACQVK
jgi:hypothetical protein